MFNSQTLFILGAGASNPYGYPLGKALIKDILTDMDDFIFIYKYESNTHPVSWNQDDQKNNYFYELDKFMGNLQDLAKSIEQIKKEEFVKGHDPNNSEQDEYCFNGKPYYKTRIRNIMQFKDLHDALVAIDPVSIDVFLRDNPSHAVAGKTMIIYSLLKKESPVAFNWNHSNSTDNWYTLLFNDIASHCADKPENLLENKLEFLTFNYDLSLEFFLQRALSSTEVFNNESNPEDRVGNRYFSSLKIDHVYGALYEREKLKDYGSYAESKEPKDKPFNNFRRFVVSLSSYTNIKTMYDERNGAGKGGNVSYKESLRSANEIIFIGFGFDRDNLDQIGIPDSLDAFVDLFGTGFNGKSRTIRYLNFKGELKSLDNEFMELQENYNKKVIAPRIKIICSPAASICSAYLHDFKKYLFK